MTRQTSRIVAAGVTLLALLCPTPSALADKMDAYQIGSHGQAHIKYPGWFKQSFLNLQEDLNEARKAGKRGIIVFFSQENCSHCQAFIDTTLTDPATQTRVRKNYDVIGLEIFNDLELTGIDGKVTTIKNFAEAARARLTPTLIFYGVEKAALLKIIGLYPPEKFNQVLDYIDGGHYQRVKLSQYLRGNPARAKSKAQGIIHDYTLFSRPPHVLDRTAPKDKRPLLVVFENSNCNPCERFHKRVLNDKEVRVLSSRFETIQLDASDNSTKLTTPDGRRLTPRQWADELQITYDIAVVFFDVQGKEVHRLDAETGRDRMTGSMQYVLDKAYQRHEQFLRWRKEKALQKKYKIN